VCHPLGAQSTARSYTILFVTIHFLSDTRTVYNLASTLAPPLTAQTSLPHTSSKASSIVPTYAKLICVLVDCGRSAWTSLKLRLGSMTLVPSAISFQACFPDDFRAEPNETRSGEVEKPKSLEPRREAIAHLVIPARCAPSTFSLIPPTAVLRATRYH
jgi:hypothetical protein